MSSIFRSSFFHPVLPVLSKRMGQGGGRVTVVWTHHIPFPLRNLTYVKLHIYSLMRFYTLFVHEEVLVEFEDNSSPLLCRSFRPNFPSPPRFLSMTDERGVSWVTSYFTSTSDLVLIGDTAGYSYRSRFWV